MINLRDCELEPHDDGPAGRKFRRRGIGAEHGARMTGCTVYELDPGHANWPYHFELVEEEWLIVIEGEVTLRTPEGERRLRAGEVACFPIGPAGAHAVRNDSDATARFAMPSSMAPYGDAVVYPDSGTFRIGGGGFNHRGRLGDEVPYWEGET